ncbi:hypothetical protein EI94DRAFT_1716399 [Lactarius quietus]|nr:hypothetical protein EI94DRAFT_1716399 [Lactarius quietus]
MNQVSQAEVIAACKDHMEQNSQKDDYRACVFIGTEYFVKYGTPTDLEPERATQEFIFNHTQQPETPVPPRIAKILYHFVEERTMYLVMERITLQESPPDVARIQEAMKWLSGVPWGGGRIRHKFFKDFKAPFIFLDVGMLDAYLKKAYGLLSVAARQKVPFVSVRGERLMFTQSDIDVSNFGVDENGRTVLMDFSEVGLLPETFVAHTLSSDKTFEPVVASLGLSGNSKLRSIAAMRQCLGTVSDPKLGMAPVVSKT